jgi:hypothetical protein
VLNAGQLKGLKKKVTCLGQKQYPYMSSWQDFANCKGKPTSMFFEDYEESSIIQLEVDALCGGCMVRQQCLEFAIDNEMIGAACGGQFITEKLINKKKKSKTNA